MWGMLGVGGGAASWRLAGGHATRADVQRFGGGCNAGQRRFDKLARFSCRSITRGVLGLSARGLLGGGVRVQPLAVRVPYVVHWCASCTLIACTSDAVAC